MASHAEVFPSNLLGYGSTFGIRHRTGVFTQPNGQVIRSGRWGQLRRSYDIAHDIKQIVDLRALQEFVVAREGAAHSFNLEDPFDFTTAADRRSGHAWDDYRIGTGDGVTTKFFLVTRYGSGTAASGCADCEVTRPLRYTSAIAAGLDATQKTGGGTDYTEDHTDASVTWNTAPTRGQGVFAGAQFYTRVRFQIDLDEWLQNSHDAFESGALRAPMIEEKLGTITDDRITTGTATSVHAGTQLTDTAASFRADGVEPGNVLRNVTDGSTATVTSVDSETVITHTALAGGSENDWDIGETWEIDVIGIKSLDRPVFGGGKSHGSISGVRYLSFQDGLFNFFSPTGTITLRLPDVTGGSGLPGYEKTVGMGGPYFVVFNIGAANWWKTGYQIIFEMINSDGTWIPVAGVGVRPNRTARLFLTQLPWAIGGFDKAALVWRTW